MRPSLLGLGTLKRGATRRRTTPAPTLCCECFDQAAWPATWCSITSLPAEQAATAASLGALRRAANGRSKPDPLFEAGSRATNRRTLHGGGVADPAAHERHGPRLRRRQHGRNHRTAWFSIDRRLIKLHQPEGDARRARTRLPLFWFLVDPRRYRLLVHRVR